MAPMFGRFTRAAAALRALLAHGSQTAAASAPTSTTSSSATTSAAVAPLAPIAAASSPTAPPAVVKPAAPGPRVVVVHPSGLDAIGAAVAASKAAAVALAGELAAAHRSYPPAFGPVQVAQWSLESDYGRSPAAPFNTFGIKARQGEPFVMRWTWEVLHGQSVRVQAPFRAFTSAAEAFEAHARLILFRHWGTGPLIYAAALQHPDDVPGFARELTGVYATDPKYDAKLMARIAEHDLCGLFGLGDSRVSSRSAVAPLVHAA